jgi:hypothetical protein
MLRLYKAFSNYISTMQNISVVETNLLTSPVRQTLSDTLLFVCLRFDPRERSKSACTAGQNKLATLRYVVGDHTCFVHVNGREFSF